MVTEKVGSGVDVLYLIGKYNIVDMLENPKMKAIMQTFWNGPFITVGFWEALLSIVDPSKLDLCHSSY
jgi:hypothetical protein